MKLTQQLSTILLAFSMIALSPCNNAEAPKTSEVNEVDAELAQIKQETALINAKAAKQFAEERAAALTRSIPSTNAPKAIEGIHIDAISVLAQKILPGRMKDQVADVNAFTEDFLSVVADAAGQDEYLNANERANFYQTQAFINLKKKYNLWQSGYNLERACFDEILGYKSIL